MPMILRSIETDKNNSRGGRDGRMQWISFGFGYLLCFIHPLVGDLVGFVVREHPGIHKVHHVKRSVKAERRKGLDEVRDCEASAQMRRPDSTELSRGLEIKRDENSPACRCALFYRQGNLSTSVFEFISDRTTVICNTILTC